MHRCIMLRPFLCAVIALTIAPTESQSQLNSSLDTPADPRSVAMGESHVALQGNHSALMSNPAGLAGIHGAGGWYAQRTIDWVHYLESFRYHTANAYAETPYGVLAVQYNHFTEGEIDVASLSSSSPYGYVTAKASAYYHTIALGFARNMVGGLSAGMTAKYHDFVMSWVGNAPRGASLPSTTPAWLFDAGLIYTFLFPRAESGIEHGVSAGTSIQNVGTKLKSDLTSGGVETHTAEQLPQYWRLGFSYALRVKPGDAGGWEPVSVLVTTEYRRMLGGDRVYDDFRDYWGFGLETTIYDLVSIRAGGVIMPYTSIYGERGKPMFRMGAGLHIPFLRLGAEIPLVISGNFTFIPIREIPMYYPYSDKSNLSAFSFEFHYEFN